MYFILVINFSEYEICTVYGIDTEVNVTTSFKLIMTPCIMFALLSTPINLRHWPERSIKFLRTFSTIVWPLMK